MDKQKIIDAVKGGMSYSEAAQAFGVTRCAVAGMCFRAGVKVGPRPEKHAAATAVAQRQVWSKLDPQKRLKRLKPAHDATRAIWANASPEYRAEHGRKSQLGKSAQ
jgi:hypothetical protein